MVDNILIMLSGGIDSTWVLWYYITNTSYNIYIHHILLRSDVENRWRQENKATKNIIEWVRKNYAGRIKGTSTSNWWVDRNTIQRDIDTSIFIGANVARGLPGTTAIATGRNLNDGGVDNVVAANRLWKVMAETYKGLEWETLKPGRDLTKKEIIKQLPKELFNLTWSCRTPKSNKQCGRCHACIANLEACND